MDYYKIRYPGGVGLTCWLKVASRAAGIRKSGVPGSDQWKIVKRTYVEHNDSEETVDWLARWGAKDGGEITGNAKHGELFERSMWSTMGLHEAVDDWSRDHGGIEPGDPDEGEDEDSDEEDEEPEQARGEEREEARDNAREEAGHEGREGDDDEPNTVSVSNSEVEEAGDEDEEEESENGESEDEDEESSEEEEDEEERVFNLIRPFEGVDVNSDAGPAEPRNPATYWRLKYPRRQGQTREGLTRWEEVVEKVRAIASSAKEDAAEWGVVEEFDVDDEDSSQTADLRDDAAVKDYGSRLSGDCWTTIGVYTAIKKWEIKNGELALPKRPEEEDESTDDDSDGSGSDEEEEGSDGEMEDAEGNDRGEESSIDDAEFNELVDSYYPG